MIERMKRGITLSDLSGVSGEELKAGLISVPTEADIDLTYEGFFGKYGHKPFVYQTDIYFPDSDDDYIYSMTAAYKIVNDGVMTIREIINGDGGVISFVKEDYSPVFTHITLSSSPLTGQPFIDQALFASVLHIRGTFTSSSPTIAAGTKLFNCGHTLTARMTHGSAINSGTAGAEAFVGISIQTNGDVYCLGALTSGVTYSIAVTATL